MVEWFGGGGVGVEVQISRTLLEVLLLVMMLCSWYVVGEKVKGRDLVDRSGD